MLYFTHSNRVGYLPGYFSPHDPRPARDQLHENYAHGGGVRPFAGFTLHNWESPENAYLNYPGDPAMREVSRATLRDETIIVFQASWVAIVQPSGEHIITRCD
jgi:hypothetical protein